MSQNYAHMLTERFLRYAAVNTQSDGSAGQVPSTPGQLELARMLSGELEDMGLENVHVDEHAIVTAVLPATMRGVPRIGFVAHLDTVDVALSPEVHPRIQRFDGGDVCLNPERDIWLRVAEHPELLPYKGQEIIFTDGTSVLGADNKAAIANIMTMLEIMTSERPAHGEIRVAFVPDEEIGLWGSKLLDLERFDVDFAYTIDCCAVGELVYETFNAGSVIFEIDGVTAHPMSAKNVLVNPLLVAADIMAGFDRAQTPEHTEGKEGYWWFVGMESNPAHATLRMHIRDFDRERYEARKAYVGK
ncbi:MAG TPA: peptidase T, partial [Candidatus Mailhella excrementigallinarum]|nr:peptidase T [Candidatus Mailhella excrementigallinarum]